MFFRTGAVFPFYYEWFSCAIMQLPNIFFLHNNDKECYEKVKRPQLDSESIWAQYSLITSEFSTYQVKLL